MRDCKIDLNKGGCNCTYEPCSRKGICCECIKYHRDAGELPACYFPPEIEQTFDRSIERFVALYNKKRN